MTRRVGDGVIPNRYKNRVVLGVGGSIEEEVVIEGANSSSSSGLVDEQCRVCGEDDDTCIKNDDETPAPTSIVKDPGAPTSQEKEAHCSMW